MATPTLEQIAGAIDILKRAGLLPAPKNNGSKITTSEVVQELNGKQKRRYMTERDIDRAFLDYNNGMSVAKIGEKLGFSPTCINNNLGLSKKR